MRIWRLGMSAITAFMALRRSRLIRSWTAVRAQRRAALVAILRAVEVLRFAPIAGNHRLRKKQIILTRNALGAPTHVKEQEQE